MIKVPVQATPTYERLVADLGGWDPRDLWPGSYVEQSPPTAGEIVEERDAGLMVLTPEMVSQRLNRIDEEDLEKRVQAAIDDGDPSNAHALLGRLREVEGFAVGYARVRACWRRLSGEDDSDGENAVEGSASEPGEAGTTTRELAPVLDDGGSGASKDERGSESHLVGDEQGDAQAGD